VATLRVIRNLQPDRHAASGPPHASGGQGRTPDAVRFTVRRRRRGHPTIKTAKRATGGSRISATASPDVPVRGAAIGERRRKHNGDIRRPPASAGQTDLPQPCVGNVLCQLRGPHGTPALFSPY
jgi:hypothetical protein